MKRIADSAQENARFPRCGTGQNYPTLLWGQDLSGALCSTCRKLEIHLSPVGQGAHPDRSPRATKDARPPCQPPYIFEWNESTSNPILSPPKYAVPARGATTRTCGIPLCRGSSKLGFPMIIEMVDSQEDRTPSKAMPASLGLRVVNSS